MKTDRLTLMVSPADKAAINARASTLGISVSELIRKAALDYDPEEAAAREEVEALLPDFSATIEQIHQSFERMIARLDESERRRDELETPEYRQKVQATLLADPTIDWARVQTLVSGARSAA
jgi:hypothetical protein